MSGLLLDNFYKTLYSMKYLFLIVIIGAFVVLSTGSSNALEIFVYLSITVFSVNSVSSTRKDYESKWNEYELIVPVKRKNIIKSKYISYLIWMFIGTIFAILITFLVFMIYRDLFFVYGSYDIASLFTIGIGMSLLIGGLFYILCYAIGANKSETVLLISIILGIAIGVSLVFLVNRILSQDINYYFKIILYNLIVLIFYVISYFITKRVYIKKEY